MKEKCLKIKFNALKVDMDNKFKNYSKIKIKNKFWIQMKVKKVLEIHLLIIYQEKVKFIKA